MGKLDKGYGFIIVGFVLLIWLVLYLNIDTVVRLLVEVSEPISKLMKVILG